MSGWPTFDRADDDHLARTLASGDPSALLQVMDRYAARLFDYCHALLRDRDTAAGALHDALVTAFAQVGCLQEPHLLRAWLYALVREECLRRLRAPDRPDERHEAPEVEDGFLGEDELARRLEARRLARSALSVLRGRERESIDLMLRHGLDAGEIGGVLDLDAQEATGLTGTARARLDDALAAAHLARNPGPDACPRPAGIARDAGWPLPAPAVRELVQHVQTCPACGAHLDPNLSAARLLGLLPVAMMPHDLRGRVMTTATDPAMAGEHAAIADRAGPFDKWGWPVSTGGGVGPGPGAEGPQDGPDLDGRRGPRGLVPALAAGGAVVLVVLVAFVLMPDPSSEPAAGGRPGPAGTAAVAPRDPSQSPTDSATPTESTSPSETATPSATPSSTSASPTRSSRPDRTPSRSSRPSRSSGPDEQEQPAGTVSGGSCSIAAPGGGCSFPVTASGGPVSWSVAGTSSGLIAADGGGRLQSGESGSVQVTLSSECKRSGSATVQLSPGGTGSVSWTCESGGDPDGGGNGGSGDGTTGGS